MWKFLQKNLEIATMKHNFGSSTQEKLKAQKREYIEKKRMSNEYREKENLKQRERDA